MFARLRRATLLVVASLLVTAVAAGCSDTDPAVTPSTTPTADRDPMVSAAAATAAGLSDEQLVGRVLMPAVDLDDSPESVAGLVRDNHLGGVIIMGDVRAVTGSPARRVRELSDAARAAVQDRPAPAGLLIGTDQEYGWVTRITSGVVQLPSAMAFGAAARPDLTETAWRSAGADLAAAGVNVDFAPDADVVGSAGNAIIGSRSYGSDAERVAPQVAAAVRGLQSAGVAAALKHFPGHGHTTTDSHDALPVLTQDRATLAANDLPPFTAGIAAGSWLVMSGHLDVRAIDPSVPASFSHRVLVDLLRGELGFTGVVVSDALNMEPAKRWAPGEAAVRALLAGNDLLLMPPDLAQARRGLLSALASGRLPRDRLLEAVTRVLTVTNRLGGDRPAFADTVDAEHERAADAVAAAAVTVLRGACTGPLVTGPVVVSTSDGRDRQRDLLSDALRAQGTTVVPSGAPAIHLVGRGDAAADLRPDAAITVAMDTPYLLGQATSATRIATYSSTKAAMIALAAVITGRATAPGRAPVEVTGLPRSACLS